MADRSRGIAAQQPRGRGIGDPDGTVGGDRDDPCRNARHHRLDHRAAVLQRGVGGQQVGGLLLQPPGHLVERLGQRADLVGAAGIRHPSGEIAALHAPGCGDQLADRADKPIRHRQRDPYGDADDQQRPEQQRPVEPQLQAARTRL